MIECVPLTSKMEGSSCLWMYTEVVQIATNDSKWNPVFQKHVVFNGKAVLCGRVGLQSQSKTSRMPISYFNLITRTASGVVKTETQKHSDVTLPKRYKADPSEEKLTMTAIHRHNSSSIAIQTTLNFIASEGITKVDHKQ